MGEDTNHNRLGIVDKIIYTVEHSLRVSEFSVAILPYLPNALKREAESIQGFKEKLRFAGLHHDFDKGTGRWPEELLIGKRHPTQEEWEIYIYPHPIESAQALVNIDFTFSDKITIEMVAYHHVRFDGVDEGPYHGYPKGKVGANLRVGPRILKPTDSLDAQLSKRAYRTKEKTVPEVIDDLFEKAGTEYDPGVVEAIYRFYKKKPDKFKAISVMKE